MRHPLVVLAIIFSLGIILADKIRISPFWPGLLAVLFLALTLASAKKTIFFEFSLCCLIFLIGVLALRNYYYLPKCHVAKFIYHKNSGSCSVKGCVLSPPVIKGRRSSFILQVKEIQLDNVSYNACGSLLVYIKGMKEFSYGQELILKGKLNRPFVFGRQGKKSYRDYFYRQGIYVILHVDPVSPPINLGEARGFKLKRFAFCLKGKIEGLIFQYLPGLSGGILDAMILGEKKNIPALVYSSMIKSGTVHILVVSGFNVGIVAFIIMSILKLMRMTRRLRVLIAAPLLILYCLVTGSSCPVVRATVMAIVFILSYLLKREADIYNSLSLSALFILGFNPAQLFDVGFQLSFVSVFSIAYLYPRLKALLRIDVVKLVYFKFLLEAGLVSVASWLGTFLFIAYYFRLFSTVTVIANLFIVPLATLITLTGFGLVIAALFCPGLAHLFACASELLVSLLLRINAFLISLPFACISLS